MRAPRQILGDLVSGCFATPPPRIKDPPQIRYSPGRFLHTAEIRGELRVTVMWSSA